MFGNSHLELLTQSHWWIIVGVTAGFALLLYAVLAWRGERGSAPQFGVVARPARPARKGNALFALAAAFVTFALTGLLAWIEPRVTGDAARHFSFVVCAFLFAILAT